MNFIQRQFNDENSWISEWKKDGWEYAYAPIQVGFDKIKLKLELGDIDYNRLQSAVNESKLNADSWLFAKTTTDSNVALDICNDSDTLYTYIKVELGNNDILTITPTGIDRKDNCSLVLHIKAHKYLGNIYNNTVEEEIAYIQTKLHEIEELTGLYFNPEYLELTEAEINMNLLYELESMSFVDIQKTIGVYQIVNGKSSNNGYTVSSIKKSTVDAMPSAIKGKRKISLYTRYTDIDINIYDKSYETKHNYNDTFDKDADRLDMIQSNYLRIEFRLSKRGIGTYLPDSNLVRLCQSDIEDAFKKIYKKCIHDNIVKYYRNWDLRLQKYFSNLDITNYKNRSAWKKDFLLDISSQLNNEGDGYLYLTKDELKSYIKMIPAPSVQKNAKKIVEQIIKEMESKREMPIKVVNEIPYKVIDEFILNFAGCQEQVIWYLPNKDIA